MKKILLLLCVCLASLYVTAQTGAKLWEGESLVDKMSPNGKYVVGYSLDKHTWGPDIAIGFKSFLWNMETGEQEWLTDFDETDYSKSGRFVDINDEKVICGWFKDPENLLTITDWGTTYTLPLNVAAVWKDGKVMGLGFGNFDISRFNNFNDGSFATAISNDSKKIVGYISAGNNAYLYPCEWVLDEASGKYVNKMYSLPDNSLGGLIYDVSADGRIAVGFIKMRDMSGMPYDVACYWTSPDDYVMIEDPTVRVPSGCAYSISPNGKYIAFTFDEFEPVLYIVDENRYVKLGRHAEVTGLEFAGVTDKGDVFGSYKYGSYMSGDMFNRPFWYSHVNGVITDFNYYTDTWASEVELPYKFTYEAKENASLTSVSADGKIIAGHETNTSFAIITDAVEMVIPPTVSLLKAKVTDLGEITVVVSLPKVPEGMVADKVTVFRDGEVVADIAIEDDITLTYIDKDVPVGERYYSAEILYKTADGNFVRSPRCEIVPVQMESTFDFPFYDNFDSGLNANGWTVVKDFGDTDYQTLGTPMFYGLNSSCCIYTAVMQFQPYSYSVVSRNMDARDKNTVYASFAHTWEYANGMDWPLDQDTVSLEVCSDGETWQVAKDIRLCDGEPGWTFDYIDLTPFAAGKLFKVRIRFHGTGAAQYVFRADELKICDKPEREGMSDVLGYLDSEGNYRLSWKNSLDAYPLTYQSNPYYNAIGLAIGDEGNTMIAANMFTKEDLEMFNGKYLTSVTTLINHNTSLEDSKDTHASIVIFEDGKLIQEQEFTPEYNADQIIKLDRPLLINASKELKIGVKIFDYDARQLPLPYHNMPEFVPGKSDLYSQDGGVTWHKLSDLWAGTEKEMDGYASWQITGNVTDSANPDIPESLDYSRFAAEVYKNGEKLTKKFVYLLEPGYTDKSSVSGDVYQVRLFYMDGTCTDLSNKVTNTGSTWIDNVLTPECEGYTIKGNELIVNTDNVKIEIYNTDGVKLYEGTDNKVKLNNFGHGIFILKIYASADKTVVYKFAF